MQRRFKAWVALALAVSLSIPAVAVSTPLTTAVAAEKPSLNTANKTLNVGQTYTLKLNNAGATVTWKSNKETVATVSSRGKVKAVASGEATITATCQNKNYRCTITVKHPSRSSSVEDKMVGPINICYSNKLFTETTQEDKSYVWQAKNAAGSAATELIKMNIMYTAPKNYSYDEIVKLFEMTFKEEEETIAMFEKIGYKDTKISSVKTSAYKVADDKAYRISVHISAEKSGEDWDVDQVMYVFSIENYLICITGQAFDDGDIGNVDENIKFLLKTMTVL